MSDIDEAELTTELVQATGEAATLAYPDWTHAVSARVLPSRGVGTWEVVAYRGDEGTVVRLFGHRAIDRRVQTASTKLLAAQGEECMGLKCTVARSGHFRVEYSYDIDEAIKWANQVFSGLTPEELVENLRPQDL
ncbi:hypothetical protein ACWF9G_04345 [Nocardia sp. NPDC055029]